MFKNISITAKIGLIMQAMQKNRRMVYENYN